MGRVCEKREAIELETQRLKSSWIVPNSPESDIINPKLETPITAMSITCSICSNRPNIVYSDVADLKNALDEPVDEQVSEQVQIAVKYAGYITRQAEDIERLRRQENTALPDDLNYSKMEGLSNEIKQKLTQLRPATLAAGVSNPRCNTSRGVLTVNSLEKTCDCAQKCLESSADNP